MCGPGMIQSEVGGEDTWGSWGGKDPLASEDGRYESLRGQTFAVESHRGGKWGGEDHYYTGLGGGFNKKGRGSLAYAMSNIDREIEHKAKWSKRKPVQHEQRFYGSDGTVWKD
tara:strand:- start:449 stop:787 length:339 start_codon:yes stop_codon:yes gene_type:complete